MRNRKRRQTSFEFVPEDFDEEVIISYQYPPPIRFDKRRRDLEFFAIFVMVTGIPLLWTLAALVLSQPTTKVAQEQMSSNNYEINSEWWGWGMPPRPNHTDSEMNKSNKDKGNMVLEAAEKISLTKDILKVATQSLNLATNTVELFNILQGNNIGDDDGAGGGSDPGGDLTVATKKQDSERSSPMGSLSKLLRISTVSLQFILQILRY